MDNAGRVRKLLKPHCTESDDHDSENCRKCEQMAEEIIALLTRVRLEEAMEYHDALVLAHRFVRGKHSSLTFGPKSLLDEIEQALKRIAALEQVATAAGKGSR